MLKTVKKHINDLLYVSIAVPDLLRVMWHGAKKHAGEPLRGVKQREHIRHAENHIYYHYMGKTREQESDCPHLAHAAVRCIMALAKEKRR